MEFLWFGLLVSFFLPESIAVNETIRIHIFSARHKARMVSNLLTRYCGKSTIKLDHLHITLPSKNIYIKIYEMENSLGSLTAAKFCEQ